MNPNLKAELLKQVNRALEAARQARSTSPYDDSSGGDEQASAKAYSLARSVVWKITTERSAYAQQLKDAFQQSGSDNSMALPSVIGALEALRDDIENDFLIQLSELVHANLFADYLEMAEHLLEEGYKDPSAVISGSTLESHLRQLCIKVKIPTEQLSGTDSRPKKAGQMNADLAKQEVYSVLDQKSITAWLDLRNKAAHGKYAEYSKEQVVLMLSGIVDFIARNPA